MGKCSKCGKKIEYNRFKVYKKAIYCPGCYKIVKPKRKRAPRRKKKIKVEEAENSEL